MFIKMFFQFNFQLDYIRRRQHISTIDTNSPTKRLLTGANLSHTHAPSDFSMHSNHSNLGYCTLRNGSHAPTSYENTISMVSKVLKPALI